MLARKCHGCTLKQTELVLAAELAERNDRATEGDCTYGCTEEQLQPVARRDLVGAHALGHNAKRKRFGHSSHTNKDGGQTNHGVHESHQLRHLGHLDPFGHQRARSATNDQSHQYVDHAQGFATRGFKNQRTGGQHGNRHADHAKQVTAQ